MIFSIFGRKKEARAKARAARDADPTTIQSTTTAPNTESHREIARRTAQKIDEIESQMDMALPARVAKPASEPAQPPLGATTALAPRPAPASIQEDNMVVFPTAQSPAPRHLGPAGGAAADALDASTSVILGQTHQSNSVEVLSSGLLPVFEEAAVLYANKQSTASAMILWQAIKENRLEEHTEQAWKMLFELYQAAGRKPEFESLAVDYASRFESSPPMWADELAPPVQASTPAVASSAIVFPELLDAQTIKQIEMLQRAFQKNRPAEVDFARVQAVDPVGADMLVRVLVDMRRGAAQLTLSGVDELRIALSRTIETGRRDASDACWQLLLETLRFLGEQQQFEDLAIDYCVTYEVSPPSWEPLPRSIRMLNAPLTTMFAEPTETASGDAFVFAGEFDGRPDDLFKALKAYAGARNVVTIDCRRLRRIDFVCAGELLNEIAALRTAGKTFVLRDLTHLVACLMMVMGIHDLAEMNLRVK
ncbi:MAG: hypothetical protein AB7P21_30855 [Lautropia sp.]